MNAATILLASILIAGPSAYASSPQPPLSPAKFAGGGNLCKADAVSVGRTADGGAVSILRKNAYLIETPRDSKTRVKALCRFSLTVNKPVTGDGILQFDLRGAESKMPLSEAEFTITLGRERYKVSYPRSQILDGSSGFRRFQLSNLPTGVSTVEVAVEASARSSNGKDMVQISLDSIDICFVNADAVDGCATLAPAVPETQAN